MVRYTNGPLGQRIELVKSEAQTIWFALEAYRDKAQHDLFSKYDGAPNWSEEDDVFLRGLVRNLDKILGDLETQGFKEANLL